jgi:serine/threonine protein kinase
MLETEVNLLQNFDHPGIIKLREFNLTGELVVKPGGKCIQIFFLVLEFVQKGDLFSLIEKGPMTERAARFFFRQLIGAVTYLHETVEVAHRDIKPENILLNSHL